MRRAITLSLALAGVVSVWSCGGGAWEGKDPVRAQLPRSSDPILAKAGLIKIATVDSTIAIDLRYKTDSAIAKRPLYRSDMPGLLRPETAVRLKKANEIVKKQGYRLKVWDAYRPPSAQLQLWDASGHDDRFVANPFNAPSQHSCGTAVDVTLVTRSGGQVNMPTDFDSFTPQAAASYLHPNPEILERRRVLQRAMREAGFYPLPNEWWHFIDRNYKAYPKTIPLSSIQESF